MHLFKPTTTKPIPATAKRFTKTGTAFVTWPGRGGKPVTAAVCESNPDRCRVTSPVWHIAYIDQHGRRRTKRAYADRGVSETALTNLKLKLARIAEGEISATADRRAHRKPADLLREWVQYLTEADRNPIYIANCRQRIAAIFDRVGVDDLGDLTDGRVSTALRAMRSAPGPSGKPISAQTSNHYLVVLKSFLKWCEQSGFIDAIPIRGLKPIECNTRRTFERRALTREELDRLVAATVANPLHRGEMSGEDRACLYLVAAFTGFRVRELASLTPDSFKLDQSPPVIVLHGRSAKNRKSVSQPFQPDLVERFTAWLSSKPAGAPVWTGYAWHRGKSNRMLRTDLRHAGIAETDADGRRVDFHALRTTFATMLAVAGVSIQSAQRLMRHSDPRLTMTFYTRLDLDHLAGEVAKLGKPDAAKG
jgi:integrase